jgi:hypothetical protein
MWLSILNFPSSVFCPHLFYYDPKHDKAVHNAERTLNLAYTNVGKLGSGLGVCLKMGLYHIFLKDGFNGSIFDGDIL